MAESGAVRPGGEAFRAKIVDAAHAAGVEMSGEGLLPDRPVTLHGDCCAAQMADVEAYLARKVANAMAIARKNPDQTERARDIARQFEVLADELRAGMHEGEALVQSALGAEVPGGTNAACGVMPPAGETNQTEGGFDGEGAYGNY